MLVLPSSKTLESLVWKGTYVEYSQGGTLCWEAPVSISRPFIDWGYKRGSTSKCWRAKNARLRWCVSTIYLEQTSQTTGLRSNKVVSAICTGPQSASSKAWGGFFKGGEYSESECFEKYMSALLDTKQLNKETRERALEISREYFKKHVATDLSRNVTWKLNKMRWDYLFNYGKGNSVDFQD